MLLSFVYSPDGIEEHSLILVRSELRDKGEVRYLHSSPAKLEYHNKTGEIEYLPALFQTNYRPILLLLLL